MYVHHNNVGVHETGAAPADATTDWQLHAQLVLDSGCLLQVVGSAATSGSTFVQEYAGFGSLVA